MKHVICVAVCCTSLLSMTMQNRTKTRALRKTKTVEAKKTSPTSTPSITIPQSKQRHVSQKRKHKIPTIPLASSCPELSTPASRSPRSEFTDLQVTLRSFVNVYTKKQTAESHTNVMNTFFKVSAYASDNVSKDHDWTVFNEINLTKTLQHEFKKNPKATKLLMAQDCYTFLATKNSTLKKENIIQ